MKVRWIILAVAGPSSSPAGARWPLGILIAPASPIWVAIVTAAAL
jgi:hypothetical protein